MRKEFLLCLKAAFPKIAGTICLFLLSFLSVSAQYYLANQKDNTHPENSTLRARPAFITGFSATRWDGYNEINWTAALQQDSRKYVIEYSVNGIDYQTAGEVTCGPNSSYTLKHTTLDARPMLYRVKTELLSGLVFYSTPVLLDGIPVLPVNIYPTIINGNTVNVNADWPVERISIISGNGLQVYTKEMGGQTDKITVVVPSSLSKGIYWMVFYGRDWKSTSKFIIP